MARRRSRISFAIYGELRLIPLGFPIDRQGLAVALDLDGSLDRIAAELAVVLLGKLLPISLPRHCERDIAVLEFAVLDLCVHIAGRNRSGQFVCLELEFEADIESLIV